MENKENNYPNCSLCKWLGFSEQKNLMGISFKLTECEAQANQDAPLVYGNDHCKKVYEKIAVHDKIVTADDIINQK